MRTLPASLAITILLLTGCDREQLKSDNENLQAQLNEERSKVTVKEEKITKLNETASNLKMFSSQINRISLEVTISCARTDGEVSTAPTIPPLGSRIVLANSSEQFHFTSNVDAPPESRATNSGVYELTLSYRPLSQAHFDDKDIGALAAMTYLKASYDELLGAVGLELRGIESVKVRVNGLLVLDATSLGLPEDGGSDLDYLDVSSHFASIPANYDHAISEWARSRSR